jgi:quercetin dioxygenase-like cupin family protein
MSKPIALSNHSDRLRVMNEVVTVLVSGKQTDGKYAVLESITQPKDGVPLLHTHPHQETFQVVEGTYQIFGRDEEGNKTATPAPAGSIIHVPGGAPHGFLNVGDTPGKLVLTVEPASMESFFRDLGTPIDDASDLSTPSGPPDMKELLETCARHGIHFLEAPPQ